MKRDVIIIDDHPLIGSAIRCAVEKHPMTGGVYVFNVALDGISFAMKIKNKAIVIIGLPASEIDSRETLSQLRRTQEDNVAILVYSASEWLDEEIKAMLLGAHGVAHKWRGIEELKIAFETIMSGRVYFSGKALSTAIEWHSNYFKNKLSKLSSREISIAKEIANGFSNKEIGEKYHISHKTASAHKANIFKKLEIKNISQLIKIL